jgi:predicted O-methyltransferase YrrM
MVGESGKVIAVDVQEEMLQTARKKAARQGLESGIVTIRAVRMGLAYLKRLILLWLSTWSMKCPMRKRS